MKLGFLCNLFEESDEEISQYLPLCLGQEHVLSSYFDNDFGLEKQGRGAREMMKREREDKRS